MGNTEIICGECKNQSTYDNIYLSERGVPKECPKCGKEYDYNFSV